MSANEEFDAVEPPPEGDAAAEARHPRRMIDRYEIIAEIARGGMGTVLLGRLAGAGGFERLMAIKLMHEHLVEDEAFVTMLLDEARTAANIHHPNAVGIVDVEHSPLGYYLVMSYVEGFTLAELIDHPELPARDRIRLGLRLFVDACHGLHAAHTTKNARGERLEIVHRDVSPQNVLVGLDGVGRIVDFGIALAASRVAASRPGVLKGKPSYMAPEQAKGEPCDARADVFALGTILWEILVGRRLFQAEMDIATLLMVMDGPIPVPSVVQSMCTEAIDAVAMKALDRDLDGRYSDARTLARELEAAASEAGLLASTHEVADAIEELFSERIAAKQEAIRHHLSTSSGEEKRLEPGQLGLVPKLYDKSPTPRSSQVGGSGVRERGIDAHARTREATPTPIRTRQLQHDEQPPRIRAAAEEANVGAPTADVEPKRGVPVGVIAAAVASLLAIGLGIAWLGGDDVDSVDAAAPPSAASVPEPTEGSAEGASSTGGDAREEEGAPSAGGGDTDERGRDETGIDRAASDPIATDRAGTDRAGSDRAASDPTETDRAGSDRARSDEAGRGRSDRPTADRPSTERPNTGRQRPRPSRDEEPAPTGPRRPTLETNPYLTH